MDLKPNNPMESPRYVLRQLRSSEAQRSAWVLLAVGLFEPEAWFDYWFGVVGLSVYAVANLILYLVERRQINEILQR